MCSIFFVESFAEVLGSISNYQNLTPAKLLRRISRSFDKKSSALSKKKKCPDEIAKDGFPDPLVLRICSFEYVGSARLNCAQSRMTWSVFVNMGIKRLMLSSVRAETKRIGDRKEISIGSEPCSGQI